MLLPEPLVAAAVVVCGPRLRFDTIPCSGSNGLLRPLSCCRSRYLETLGPDEFPLVANYPGDCGLYRHKKSVSSAPHLRWHSDSKRQEPLLIGQSAVTGHPLPRTASHYSVDADCKLLEFNLTINGRTGATYCNPQRAQDKESHKVSADRLRHLPSSSLCWARRLSSEGNFNSNTGVTPLAVVEPWMTSR